MAKTDMDRVLVDVGQFGRYQIGMYILLNLMEVIGGMHHLGQVFLARSFPYNCADDVEENEVSRSSCYKWSNTTMRTECESWDYNITEEQTLVTEYDLVCNRVWMKALSQTLYMLGVLVGVIGFGALSDKYGRRSMILLTSLIMAVVGSACAFTPSYWGFVMLRLVVGAVAGGNMTTLFVFGMEIIGGKARTYCGVLVQCWFGVGVIIFTLMAYYIHNYRYLQLTISIIYIVFLSYYWFMPESVRWLLANGRTEEAEEGIKQMARINRKPCPLLEQYEVPELADKPVSENSKATVLDLYRTPNLRKKTINIQFNWFVNSVVYYGISLLATEFAGQVYINCFLSGLSEILGTAIFAPISECFGRRKTLAFCLILSGLVCIGAIPIPSELGILQTALALIGKLFISASFAVIYVFSAELFPTVVRNVGVGNGSMCARIGGLIAPFISLLNEYWRPLPFIVFGSLAVTAGLLSLLLPETLGQKLPETIEDGERFGKKQPNTPDIMMEVNRAPETSLPMDDKLHL